MPGAVRWGQSRSAAHARTLTTSQDHRTESGKPSGKLKISEVPELPGKEKAKAFEKKE
jgi:hypothetical protein